MKIIKTNEIPENLVNGDYHILTFAEKDAGVLNTYAQIFNIPETVLEQFIKQSNQTDETGTLYPKAPISVIPSRYIMEIRKTNELQGEIMEFLNANQQIIKARRVVFDFRNQVDTFVIEACEKALKTKFAKNINLAVIIE